MRGGAKGSAQWAEIRRGWQVLLGCTLGLGFGVSILLYINGVFVNIFRDEFGWTKSQLAMMNVISVSIIIPLTPIAGLIVDRWGVRLPAAIGMVMLALGFTATGLMNGSFPLYVVLYISTGIFGLLSSPISYTRAINEHFDAARGLALAIALTGLGITGMIAPPAITAVIAAEGWRMGYFALAAAVVAAIIPVYWLLGQAPKKLAAEVVGPAKDVAREVAIRLRMGELFADACFLRLLAVFFFMAVGVTGFTMHLIPMLTDGGMSPLAAAGMQSLFGLAAICGRLSVGAAVDHFFAPYVAAISMCFTVLGIIAMAVGGLAYAPIFVIAIGFALGAEGDLIAYFTARYFGLTGYGQRYGMFYASYLLANGFSPLLIALIADGVGSYQPALWMCAGFGCIAILLLLTAPRFPKSVTLTPATV